MPTRRTILTTLALTSGAALTRKLPALEISPAAIATHESTDPMRPQYHLLPVSGWMNDPCGPIYWRGKYHMFYQYNDAPISGVKLWAHAISPDMVRWRREPIALAPIPGGPDAEGCWTGTAAVVDGKVAFLYTGVVKSLPDHATLRDGSTYLRESVCMAIAQDDALLHWRKLPEPVIPTPPAGMQVTGFRDPSPWRERGPGQDNQDPGQGNQDQWYTVVASGQRGVGGMVLLYKSSDFHHWDYLHPLARGKWNGKQTDVVGSGEMWECPDFFELDGKHVLIHSTEGRTLWQIGTLDRATMLFDAESEGVLDHGAYYAPKSQLDAKGNRILWGWIQETRPQAEYSAAGWSGMMSLPRRLSIANGVLIMTPAPEIAFLRTGSRTNLAAVKRLPTPAQEIRLTLQPGSEPMFDTSFVDHQGAALLLRNSMQQAPSILRVGNANIPLPDDLPLDLHIFLDHSVAEIFINQRHAVTHRYYARTPMEPAVAIILGGPWRITQQQAWSLKSIW
jgi:beta-fructofuranosidase